MTLDTAGVLEWQQASASGKRNRRPEHFAPDAGFVYRFPDVRIQLSAKFFNASPVKRYTVQSSMGSAPRDL